ncbi:MAG: ABC transporter ATP-binding protein [Anaerolineae bacterium]
MSSIVFENVSKRFALHHDKARSFQDILIKRLRRQNGNDANEEFWALRDVSFEIPQGQMVGFIGPNGAGKSTALKLIARIIEPTGGKIRVNGRVNALIELSAGFHEELTGRENIYLSAALLGMSRPDIQKRFDAIIDFSGLEKFIDTQVKHYSSGMHVRLGFAIATCVESDVLLVDEVLAVGDTNFQKKSFERIAEIRARGTTIIYVSHQLTEVERSCDRAILLMGGGAAADGEPANVIRKYEELTSRDVNDKWSVYRVEYVDYTLPAELTIGVRGALRATLCNRSAQVWHGANSAQRGTRLVSLGYRWVDLRGKSHQQPGPRTLLPHDLGPGESIQIEGTVLPPQEPGLYVLEMDLMAEGVGWVSWGGCMGPRAHVQVLPPAPAAGNLPVESAGAVGTHRPA